MRKLVVVAIASCSSAPAEDPVPGAVCELQIDPWNTAHAEVAGISGVLSWLHARFELPDIRGKAVDVPATPHPVTSSVHRGPIAIVAAPEDGSFAVTADTLGGIRLWPSLDGKREPVVVAARPPAALAVARVDGEIVIAGLDVSGGIEIVRTSPAGEPRGRVIVDAPRPYRMMRALPAGFLAVRDDQTIDRIDGHGAIAASLVPEPGSSIGALAVRRGKAIAIVGSAGGVHGRWLDLAGGLAWGATTPKLPILPTGAELSPDGHHLLGVYTGLQSAAIVNLETARTFAIPWERADFKEPMLPLGFTGPSAATMTSTFGGGVLWWQDDTTTRGFSGAEDRVPSPSIAVDGRVISGWHEMLVLSTSGASEFLGYRMLDIQQIRGTRDGWLVGGEPGAPMLELDARFHERRRFEPPIGTQSVMFADDRHAIAMLTVDNGRARNLYSIDLLHPEANELAWQTTGYAFSYEPSTHLVAVSADDAVEFARLDPKTGVIGAPIEISMPGHGYQHTVVLLDPARTHNIVAVILDNDYANKTLAISEVRPTAGGLAVARQYELDPTKPDAAGRALRRYGVDRDGKSAWRTSPDGKWAAKIEGARLSLRDRAGDVKWVADAHGATELAWRPTGELAVINQGIAAVDLATGALGDRQCGWQFGLSTEAARDRGFGTSLCEAP